MTSHLEFDWYISPADRFLYEGEFTKYAVDNLVPMSSMETVFTASRLSQQDFVQANFIDIQNTSSLNKEQYVAFSHVLNMRRKGKTYPLLPQSLREKFLADESTKTLGRGAARDDDPILKDLESDIQTASSSLSQLQAEKQKEVDRLATLKNTKEELEGLLEYKRRQLEGMKDEIVRLRSASPSGGNPQVAGLMNKLSQDRQTLVSRREEIQRTLDSL
ncbi:hypothetical protein SmJEL517_g01890 [Synchytrium microbalum]|uniref:EH domain-containing protein n=1 Tax=Synchytrium microbalum TaxID=1806994 RepID=A0A507CDZ6_9FUNG|nr:uncharacterized protein SmJEL517_g01890 [Synchytrium microbalum]TPX35795.1 hypothetical protein SmJEL517_g01890 [Synchytrium microbalum]